MNRRKRVGDTMTDPYGETTVYSFRKRAVTDARDRSAREETGDVSKKTDTIQTRVDWTTKFCARLVKNFRDVRGV